MLTDDVGVGVSDADDNDGGDASYQPADKQQRQQQQITSNTHRE